MNKTKLSMRQEANCSESQPTLDLGECREIPNFSDQSGKQSENSRLSSALFTHIRLLLFFRILEYCLVNNKEIVSLLIAGQAFLLDIFPVLKLYCFNVKFKQKQTNKPNRHKKKKKIASGKVDQDILGFWIPGTGLQFPNQWSLNSGFQSLAES